MLRLPPRPGSLVQAVAPPPRPPVTVTVPPSPSPGLDGDLLRSAAQLPTARPVESPSRQPAHDANGMPRWTPAHVLEVLRVLEPDERMQFLAAVEGRAAPLLTFRAWIADVRPGYVFYRYSEVLIRVLQDVADGLRPRVMVFMPPQLGKSELVSRLFAAYYLYRYPDRGVGLATYGAELSHQLSRDARANFEAGGGELARGSRSVKHWRTRQGGGLWAVGAGGAAAGRGFSLGIVDDPLKDAEEAASQRIRVKRQDWYDSVFLQRKSAGAAIVILMTRWHLEDLAGTLLNRETAAPEHWHVVRLPSIAEPPRRPTLVRRGPGHRPAELDDPDRLPPTCTQEPDWRRPGESVCEERKPIADLRQIMRALGGESGYFWNSLHQQRPVPLSGGMFKRSYFIRVARSALPPLGTFRACRGWDFGATEGGGDKTVGILLLRGLPGTAWAGRSVIAGYMGGQWGPAERDAKIRETMQADGPSVHQRAPQDPAQAGKTHGAHFAEMCRTLDPPVPYSLLPVSGEKALNALPVAADAGAGYYYVVDEPWAEVVLRVLTQFGPASSEDDEVDALWIAHHYHGVQDRADASAMREGRAPASLPGMAGTAAHPSPAVSTALAYLYRR